MNARDDTAPVRQRHPVHMHSYESLTQWTWGAAVAISSVLARDLQERPRARLLLSGGGTPRPVYEALSKAPLDWSRVDVALVDERWLLPDDPDSNSRLVRESLLRNNAASARFESITRTGRSIEEAVSAANLHAQAPPGVVVLGMGEDGHTASLFPRMQNLQAALDSRSPYVAVDATGCPGAGRFLRRISLTPAGLAPAHTRLLLIRGESKRKLLERVLEGDDPLEYPARIAFLTPGAPLHVHWCP
ncbi:6-phosphogluconolactonase [Luteimonas sp. J16]|jgi:6-phosphogluconolactonase|uniref:6-phosphogluconolactonase n=1 Tax=unclassified Luteimonas TaxID=2629088 RepID=UPI0004B881AD|nr:MULTISPECIES: 6-phosphogluconolactonase [unclassified Luteimonas]TWG92732.1 6-phosphogluconolactonase [Luteimonas sp. J16]